MSTFDSPIARCEVMRQMVLTDQTQPQCALEHGCPAGMVCPLCGYFVSGEALPVAQPPAAPERPAP